MAKDEYKGKVSEMSGQVLDYWMYRHAAKELGHEASPVSFDEGYAQGLYRFSQDKALLADLMLKYDIRMQMLGGEWLASTESNSKFGDNPIEAACRLVVSHAFGDSPSL